MPISQCLSQAAMSVDMHGPEQMPNTKYTMAVYLTKFLCGYVFLFGFALNDYSKTVLVRYVIVDYPSIYIIYAMCAWRALLIA